MYSTIYDVSNVVGILLTSIGAGISCGVGVGLIVAGVLVIAVNIYTTHLVKGK